MLALCPPVPSKRVPARSTHVHLPGTAPQRSVQANPDGCPFHVGGAHRCRLCLLAWSGSCSRASALVRRSVRRSNARNLERLPHGACAVSTGDSLALCAGNLREAAVRSLEAPIAVGPEYWH